MTFTEKIVALINALLGLRGAPAPPDTTPPTITLAANQTIFNSPGPLVLTPTVADNLGSIDRVEYYDGNELQETARAAPYTFTRNITAESQSTTYRAVVYDLASNTGEDSVAITVAIVVVPPPDTTGPTVSLSAVLQNRTVILEGTASDPSGIRNLKFHRKYPDGSLQFIRQENAAPYEAWQNVTEADNGDVTYVVIAEDKAGNTKEAEATVTINLAPPADTTPPTLALSVSPNPITAPGRATLTGVTSSDTVRLELKRESPNQAPMGQLSGPPWVFQEPVDLTNAQNGVRKFSGIAYDAAGNPSPVALAEVTVNIPGAPPTLLTRSRKRSDYTLSNTTLTVTKAALLAGFWGQPNAEGWYEIVEPRIHSLTPGEPCILIKYFDIDLKVKIVRPVLDGLGTAGSNKGGLIVSENEGSVWVDDYLLFSNPPPVGGNGAVCVTARSITASSPREIKMTRGESYGTGGIYIDGVAKNGKFRGIYVGQALGFNIRGTGYTATGDVRLTVDNRIDRSAGYYAQFFQLNNAPEAPEGSVIVEWWGAHTDPNAMIGRNAGQREDVWNIHSSGGAIIRHYFEENGLPWDPAWTGANAVYGVDPASPSGRGYGYSGSGGLGDGYTKTGFVGTPGPNDVTHQVYAEDGTSLNNANVGYGVTAGNRTRGTRLVSYMAGVIRSNAPGGYSRIAVKAAPAPAGETGNNAAQAYQFYKAQGLDALFYDHALYDSEGSYNWLDNNGVWQQHVLYISDPAGSVGSGATKTYNSIKFFQNGVELAPYNGGIKIIPKPKTVAEALATLDQKRRERIDTFIAAGKVLGMSDRPLGDVTNYWQGVP